ncbi:MAG: LLM class flavin-dependent oxidoreductase [bacterium]
MLEVWTNSAGLPSAVARRAESAEAAGYDGVTTVDSQNLSGDCYIGLALAATGTSRIKLGTGVTNTFTRHPAVTACAIATVQAVSQGRAVLGIGRGDSALAHLGFSPSPVSKFEDYLWRLQGYLRGEEVPFEAAGNVDALRLANQPTSSKIEWIRPGRYPKVPVDVAATGPKVIAAAARHADSINFAVGADPARIHWGMETARESRRKAGIEGEMGFGAYVNVVVHDDPEVGRRMGEGGVSLFARFSAMHGSAVGPTTAEEKRVMEGIHDAYDMTRHSRAGSPQAAVITSEFATEFGIFGDSNYCLERLKALVRLGLTRLIVVGSSAGSNPDEATRAEKRFVEEVLPGLR